MSVYGNNMMLKRSSLGTIVAAHCDIHDVFSSVGLSPIAEKHFCL
jgi:hypothetical protein